MISSKESYFGLGDPKLQRQKRFSVPDYRLDISELTFLLLSWNHIRWTDRQIHGQPAGKHNIPSITCCGVTWVFLCAGTDGLGQLIQSSQVTH